MSIPVTPLPRKPSPLGGRKPTKTDLPRFASPEFGVDDVLPADPDHPLQLLIVGINPGLWTAAVNAPFARPGNRFWPSLVAANLVEGPVDVAAGMPDSLCAELLARGIGVTNLVARPTARADELSREELEAGARGLVERVRRLRPAVVAIAGITAFRDGFGLPHAQIGRQDPGAVPGWPTETVLWVVPQPSGLNAHYQVDDLAEIWHEVWHSRYDAPSDPGRATDARHGEED